MCNYKMNYEDFLKKLNDLSTLWVASEGNIPLQQEIEENLRPLIEANKYYSREYLFEINVLKNHAVGVDFIPTTDAYKKYGASVTICNLLEIDEIRKNFESKIDTTGYIKAFGFISKGLEKCDMEICFQTNEILEIGNL